MSQLFDSAIITLNTVNKAFTERYKRSAIPSMQRLLNSSEKDKIEIFKKINSTVPVNYGLL